MGQPIHSSLQTKRPCPAGLQPDGFLDWSKLPAPQTNTAINATIPVTGVPGLTATVQIPAGALLYTQAPYLINSPIDLQVASSNKVTLIFNKPIRGIKLSTNFGGRFYRQLILDGYESASEIGGSAPAEAEVTASALDTATTGDLNTVPLQIRSESADLTAFVLPSLGSEETVTYDLFNLRVESGSAPDPSKQVPTNGLKQWLRADTIYSPYYRSFFPDWPDQSGNHADASGPGPITAATADGPNCAAAYVPGPLTANLPINGWTGMTVFLVSRAATDAAGWYVGEPLFWKDAEQWGATFVSPSQSNVFFRFGTTQVNNQPIYPRPVTAGGDYTLTTAMHDGTTDRLFLNGVLALTQSGKNAAIAGVSSTESIGLGLNGSPFSGAIGEILVYNRALSDHERSVVEHYLTAKFGIY